MAIMCPDMPRCVTIESGEKQLFYKLEEKLPNDYYVFHSLHIMDVDEGCEEHEIDFTIFHPSKGILVIEAKNGHPYYENGIWYYGSGIEMAHGGPFQQAAYNKRFLRDKVKKERTGVGKDIANNCKFLHAVWFPGYTKKDIQNSTLPEEADSRIILTGDSYECLEQEISDIMDRPCVVRGNYRGRIWTKNIETKLDKIRIQFLLNSVLAPQFHVISVADSAAKQKKRIFKSLIEEQKHLLDYLEEQPYAVINGRAGTGKTVIAVEKARREAGKGERVLFLTFNKMLAAHLRETYNDIEGVDFYNIHALIAKELNVQRVTEEHYYQIGEKYMDNIDQKRFRWQHIIVDEGQDFGIEGLSALLEIFQDAIHGESEVVKSFYVFYDRNQLVHGKDVPNFIQEADCKLTLFQNCRNTNQIADTSEMLLKTGMNGRKFWRGKIVSSALNGDYPQMYILKGVDMVKSALDNLIKEDIADGYDEIQILTCCSPINESIIYDSTHEGYYLFGGKKFPITTCRKFKGLEADAVILLDIDKRMFSASEGTRWDDALIPYVGASRAKYRLGLIASFTDEECVEILKEKGYGRQNNPKRAMTKKIFHANYRELK